VAALPLQAVPVIVDDQVRLRTRRGSRLEIEMPLRRRQALVLAAQLLNMALMPECSSSPDSSVLETPEQNRVASRTGNSSHGR
jgi:hypothetical protein